MSNISKQQQKRSLELALPNALLGSSLGYAAPAVTASVMSSLTTTAAVDWASTQQHNVVNGTTIPATAIATILLECDVCAHPGEQQHQTTNTCLLDTAVQQAAGGGGGVGEDNNGCVVGSASASSVAATAAMATGTTLVATLSPQEKWLGGSLLTQEGSLMRGPSAVKEEEEAKSGATVHATAEAAAMWENLAILSGAMTVVVGVILWQ